MKLLTFLTILWFMPGLALAQDNVEIHATYTKDNPNYIYMESKTEQVKLKKAELTEDGVKQILGNKEKPLILFVPKKAVVYRNPKPEAEEE